MADHSSTRPTCQPRIDGLSLPGLALSSGEIRRIAGLAPSNDGS